MVILGAAAFAGKFKGSIIGDGTRAGCEAGDFVSFFFGLVVSVAAVVDFSSF